MVAARLSGDENAIYTKDVHTSEVPTATAIEIKAETAAIAAAFTDNKEGEAVAHRGDVNAALPHFKKV